MSRGFSYSLLLHLAVLVLIWSDLPDLFKREYPIDDATPIFVDLSEVEIADKTNLPPALKEEKKEEKVEAKEEKKEVKQEKISFSKARVVEEKDVKIEPKIEPEKIEIPEVKEEKIEKIKEEKVEVKEVKIDKTAFLPPPVRKPKAPIVKKIAKKEESKKKEKKKAKKKEIKKTEKVNVRPVPKVPSRRPKTSKEEVLDPLSNLLASVDTVRKQVKSKPRTKSIGRVVTGGIKGGTGGHLGQKLTISQKDAIRVKLQKNWNLDPGARGIENMIVEIVAYLNQDGSVSKVEFVDKGRYKKDAFYKSVAESARRAVLISSPFDVPENKYEIWQTMRLFFNPMTGGVK